MNQSRTDKIVVQMLPNSPVISSGNNRVHDIDSRSKFTQTRGRDFAPFSEDVNLVPPTQVPPGGIVSPPPPGFKTTVPGGGLKLPPSVEALLDLNTPRKSVISNIRIPMEADYDGKTFWQIEPLSSVSKPKFDYV